MHLLPSSFHFCIESEKPSFCYILFSIYWRSYYIIDLIRAYGHSSSVVWSKNSPLLKVFVFNKTISYLPSSFFRNWDPAELSSEVSTVTPLNLSCSPLNVHIERKLAERVRLLNTFSKTTLKQKTLYIWKTNSPYPFRVNSSPFKLIFLIFFWNGA